MPRLDLCPHRTRVTGLVRVKPGFQRGQQLVALFGGQFLFGGFHGGHSLDGRYLAGLPTKAAAMKFSIFWPSPLFR